MLRLGLSASSASWTGSTDTPVRSNVQNDCGKRKTEHFLQSTLIKLMLCILSENVVKHVRNVSLMFSTTSHATVITMSTPQWTLPVCLQLELGANGRWGKAFPVYWNTSFSWPLHRLLCNFSDKIYFVFLWTFTAIHVCFTSGLTDACEL